MAKLDVYLSDDYSGVEGKKYSFYYGYEYTRCKRHKKHCQAENSDDQDCLDEQWCFVATERSTKKEIYVLKQTDIEKAVRNINDLREPGDYLLAGISLFIEKYLLK